MASPETKDACIDLLAGYMDKLRKAEVVDLSLANAQRLLEACPNVRLCVIISLEWTMEAVKALSERVDEICFLCLGVPSELLHFSQVTELFLSPAIHHHAPKNKKNLKKLHALRRGAGHPYELVKTTAESTGNLRYLRTM